MTNTNYISSIVKIVESPRQKLVNKIIPMTEFRVQLPQLKNNHIIKLVFWGNLAKDVIHYYKLKAQSINVTASPSRL